MKHSNITDHDPPDLVQATLRTVSITSAALPIRGAAERRGDPIKKFIGPENTDAYLPETMVVKFIPGR